MNQGYLWTEYSLWKTWSKVVRISLFGKIQQIQKINGYLAPADIKLKRNEVGNMKTDHDNMPT